MNASFVLWGWTSNWREVTRPIPVMGGSLRECRSRERQFKDDYSDALTGTYARGDEPKGLSLQVEERISQ